MRFIPPLPTNRYADGSPAMPLPSFPPNLAASLPEETQKKVLLWLSSKYLWPQIQERVPFERMWDKMLEIARITIPNDELFSNTQHAESRAKNQADESNRDKARVSDSVVHDAIDRLTNITRFIAFKEKLPVKFSVPSYIKKPYETKEYSPTQNRVDAGNALLEWNSDNHDLSRNATIAFRHHYTYGVAYVESDYVFRVEQIARQDNNGGIVPRAEITAIGTTFKPISIRKIWLNWRLPAYRMDAQPCPFYFEETPRFAILQNVYEPRTNPFGYVNLDKLFLDQWLYNEQAFEAAKSALNITYSLTDEKFLQGQQLAQILQPKHSVEALWKIFPMLPLDPQTGEFDHDGTKKIPYRRFVIEMFGPNIHSGSQVLLRLQEMYYPKGKLPIYASVHMPDLDSGQYAPSVGQLLYNHFKEITLCHEQFLQNKDWINDPPAWCQISSPALTRNLNQKGAKIEVNGPNDFGWRVPFDATASTVAMIQMLKDDAKTTSKAVDAVLGKAMGSRTTATEANNVFQAAMSGITSDIDLLCSDLFGTGYADRVWDYTGLWMDKDLLQAVTGQFGFALKPEDMWISVGLQTNTGSTFIEKSVQQQNLRYILESGKMDPTLDRAELWTQLLDAMGFDGRKIVDDGGKEQQIQFATLQACETYLGMPVTIDPDQDHQLALRIKTAFLKDKNSVWNTQHGAFAGLLVQQCQIHQQFIQLQYQMMLAQQQIAIGQQQLEESQSQASTKPPATSAGQAASQQGGTL